MDTQGNILKLSFLISYLALLICVVVGIPFMTSVFRAIVLMCVFALMGYSFRWFLLHVVSSVQPDEAPRALLDSDEDLGEFDMGAGEDYVGDSMDQLSTATETVDHENGQA